MVLVNYTTRELTAKLVYYGPGLCGKTTNLQYVYDALLPDDRRGKMVSLATETDRTLFFDFLPLEIGTIRGLKTRLQLYTVPGQVHYNATRKIVLKGADGIVFVADSQRSMKQANKESFANMKENLTEHGLSLKDIPHVIQFNKRDLPDVMPIEELFEDLNEYNMPFWEAVAVQGVGVEDTLKSVTKLVLKNLALKFAPDGSAAVEGGEAPAAEVPPVPESAEAPLAAEPVAAEAALPEATPLEPEAVPEVATPLLDESTPFGGEAAAPAADSPLMTSTGELLALEFDGSENAPAAAEDEVLEVGEDALLLDEEPTTKQPAVAMAEDSPFGSSEPEAEPAAPAAEAAVAAEPFGLAPEPPPEAAVVEDAASALDGLEMMGTPEPVAASAGPPPLPAGLDAGETIAMPSEAAKPDLEMPGLDGAADSGDTVLSPVGDIEGLATEADLPVETPALDDLPALDDIPEVPGMDGPPPPLAPDVSAPLPAVPGSDDVAAVAALAADDELVDLPTTLSLGEVQGEVEKTLRLPIEWTDASGQGRQRSLEIKIRFKLD